MPPSRFQSRRFALSAIVIAYVLVEVALWTRGRTQLAWSVVGAIWIVWATVRQKRTAQQLGIGTRGLVPSLWVVPAAIGAALLMVLAGRVAGTLHGLDGPNSVLYHWVGYALWAIEQEFILQSFFYVNVEQLAGNRLHSAVIATALFAAAHIPNPLLVSATLVVGICFTQLFRRYRNIYALGIAHGLLGLALAVSVSDNVHHHMRVGLGYLLYQPNAAAPAPTIFGLPHR